MAISKPTLILIKGESILNVPSPLSPGELIGMLTENGYIAAHVYNKGNLITFVHPEKKINEGDTLIIFDKDGKLSFCKYDERYAKELAFLK